jgi:short-subunit dehydrogenase
MHTPRTILITGASSGLGEALALTYARADTVLALHGRDAQRLDSVADECRRRGATAITHIGDVTQAVPLSEWIRDVDSRHPIDTVIANAGLSGGTARGIEGIDQTRRIFAVNVDGVINTVMPLIVPMARRGTGQIGIMSSLAAFRGMPGAPAYCASKAAVRIWGEALRAELAPKNVGVSVICPGFVVSRMTASNEFHMPMLMTSERAASIIARGLARNRGRIAFPWPMYALARIIAALPATLMDPLLRRAPRKG